MLPIVLRYLNPLGLLLLAMLACGAVTSFFRPWPLYHVQPDMILFVVLWCALRRGFYEGGVLTLLLANVAELHSSSPQGLLLTIYMAIYLLVRATSKLVALSDTRPLVVVTFAASMLARLAGLAILNFLATVESDWVRTLALATASSALQCVIGIWVYRWLSTYDLVTSRRFQADIGSEAEFKFDET